MPRPEFYRYHINTIPSVVLRQDAIRMLMKSHVPDVDRHGDIPSDGFQYNTGALTFRARPLEGSRVIWLNLINSASLMKAHYTAGKMVQMNGVRISIMDGDMIMGEVEVTKRDDRFRIGESQTPGESVTAVT